MQPNMNGYDDSLGMTHNNGQGFLNESKARNSDFFGYLGYLWSIIRDRKMECPTWPRSWSSNQPSNGWNQTQVIGERRV